VFYTLLVMPFTTTEDGLLAEIPPDDCPSGHPFRCVLVGWTPCGCPQPNRGGHRKWYCACGQVVLEPEHDADVATYKWTIGT
jgi:hypothetical protein